MRFSHIIVKDEYKPNPQARAKDREAAVTRLLLALYNDLDVAVKTGQADVSSQRHFIDLNELAVSLGGKPQLDRAGRQKKLLVEDYDLTSGGERWLEGYVKSLRSYGPRGEGGSSASTDEYVRLKSAVEEAHKARVNPKATKDELRDALDVFLQAYRDYAVRLQSLKGTVGPINEWLAELERREAN